MTYVNEHSVLGVGILFIVKGTVAITTRFYIQCRSKRLGVDDWLALAAWVLVTGEAVIMIIGAVTHTVGALSPVDIGAAILYYDGWDRIFWTLIGVVIAWGVTFVIALMTTCGAIITANFGTLNDLMTSCSHSFAVLIAPSASDVAVDVIILTIPLPLVLSLHLNLHKGIGIIVVLLVGSMATACGIARMSLFAEILGPTCILSITTVSVAMLSGSHTIQILAVLSTQTVGGVSSTDDIGIVSILMFGGMLETGVAIVAICLPILYRIVRDVSPGAQLHNLVTFRQLRTSKDDDSSSLEGAKPGNESTVALPKLMHPVVTADVVLNAQQHSPRSQIWEMKEIQRTVEVV
ncbi:uncharacterized protein BO66DRAFT_440202 [Aspergillus aculeatinus CBS 121060]|uniref:Uncharacterized protein n=1 Tax=Aspergillus aculeatinus CBS 121060 TaxID=1448322 RepID=A0ACD1H3X5_9EURO|nr:hypothetical protein BO66DRAFT_440202 [Aspergillus aculeatinus CBS 121060]RAH68273.1 hypothetical protein BO66DRAFT_440202 [Aspergillus aculeatinus CBS 121060]